MEKRVERRRRTKMDEREGSVRVPPPPAINYALARGASVAR